MGNHPFYKVNQPQMVMFNSFLYVYQRINPYKIPLNPIKPPFSSGFPMVFQHFKNPHINGHVNAMCLASVWLPSAQAACSIQ